MNLQEIIKSGKSIKEFRGALLEASRTFASGSLADLVFNFYNALRKYYFDLLTYQFQLYSDLPHYMFGISSIKVTQNKKVKFYSFSNGKNKNLSLLQDLNDVPFNDISEIQYTFELSPEITNLVASTENNTNKQLFTKVRDISVAKGDGTYITGKFTPEWKNNTLTLTCAGVTQDTSTPAKMFRLTGGV